MNKKVLCQGMGVVSPIGQNLAGFAEGLRQQTSGVKSLGSSVTGKTGALVPGFTLEEKFVQMAEQALFEALFQAELALEEIENNRRVGLVLGTSLANTVIQEAYFKEIYEEKQPLANGETLLPALMGHLSSVLRRKLKLKGPVYTISNTCVSGINAIALGEHLIKSGQVDCCLVGSVEILGELILTGLDSLNALSSRERLEPFAFERDGIILGEGAGFIVLVGEGYRPKPGCGWVAGTAITNDGVHLTAPDREGRGLILAIQQSLAEAGLKPAELGAIFCCGTGTKYNDAMQALAIDQVWQKNLAEIPITTIKPLIGHTLGAAGLIESIAILLMMQQGWVVPIGTKYNFDPEITQIPLLHEFLKREIKSGILLGSGFTGVNGALVWRKD